MFDSAKERCVIRVLRVLEKRNETYSNLFKKTKFSHITLQNSLKYLVKRNFIKKIEFYEITKKGEELLEKLEDLKSFV